MILELVLTVVLPAVGTSFFFYYKFKSHLHKIRQFVDVLDDALYDDKVTEEEYRQLWERFKEMIT